MTEVRTFFSARANPLAKQLTGVALQMTGVLCLFAQAQVWQAQVSRAQAQEQGTSALDRWRGLYVGGSLGYRSGHAHANVSPGMGPGLDATAQSYATPTGTVHMGYNYVTPSRWLFGLEVDATFPDFLEGRDTAVTRTTAQGELKQRIDQTYTLRGRVGHVFEHWMLYGTGGVALMQTGVAESPGVTSDTDKSVHTRLGWAAGFGAEFAIGATWTGRLEYLYERTAREGFTLPSGTAFSSQLDDHTVRFGLSQHFNAPSNPRSAQELPPALRADRWSIHGQATYVQQGYPAFRSPYEGENSLRGGSHSQNTVSATAFIGWRAFNGTEFYINPELMQGFGLSDVRGVAAFPNGEAQKSSFPNPRVNIARAFVRHTIGFGGEQETIEDGANQIAGKQDISRLTIMAGKMSVTDVFNTNAYSQDPRVGFLNWNIYGGGSYDWTMDKLSYTYGALAELNQRHWAFRAGYFLVPVTSNSNQFDWHVAERGEVIAELEMRYALFSQPGKLRLMPWINVATAGSYADAVALSPGSAGYPDIALTRRVRPNVGFVVNLEQAITSDLGVFSRLSWNGGKTEKIGWTDADETVSLGAVLKGTTWGRPTDKIGVAGVLQGLSKDAKSYFAAGGLGILIGDGQLNYRPELALETYYAWAINKSLTLTPDYQLILNPGYNADRGPVSVFSARLHAEF